MSEESRAVEYRRMMAARCNYVPSLAGSAAAYAAALERTQALASGADGWTWDPPCDPGWDDPKQAQKL